MDDREGWMDGWMEIYIYIYMLAVQVDDETYSTNNIALSMHFSYLYFIPYQFRVEIQI